ncbi:MAG TPA: MopE-related protein, partial [Chitinophagales bacterium]|nr:MopE-related protein [Chitinophagales bacterium]HRG87207.1 MopE-related protein [Chitinophagales bacterium]HRH54930.1 MopE-related protein [Chitinophagales bacterium]
MKLIVTSLFIILSFTARAQVPEIIWQHSYGGSGWDQANAVKQTPDGGYIVAGYTYSLDGDVTLNQGLSDYWVLKLNSLGVIEWEKTYGGSATDDCSDITLWLDGGYILAGQTFSVDGDVSGNNGSYDYWIVKIDESGDVEWQKCFGGSAFDAAHAISNTIDGGYIIIGESQSSDGDVTGHHGGLTGDYWVVKIDTNGEIEWENSYGTDNIDDGKTVIQTSDEGYLLAGYGDGLSAYYQVIKIDNEGELQWVKTFGGSSTDIAYDILETSTGEIMVVGTTNSDDFDVSESHGAYDTWVLKLNSLGNIIWENTYGGSQFEEGFAITEVDNLHFIVVGASDSEDGDLMAHKGYGDFWIFDIDSSGAINWQKSFGGSNNEIIFSIEQVGVGEYVVSGYSRSNDFDLTENNGDFDFWILKLAVCNTKWYLDYDGDGFGDVENDSISCLNPVGYVADSTDCNDLVNSINPSVIEICNGIDDNCNIAIDEDLIFTDYYVDEDGDNYGNLLIDSLACELPIGYVTDNTDCDDTNADIYPGAEEVLNGIDDDCDQIADEGLAVNAIVKNTIHIFPNPVNSILFIQSDETQNITIVNQLGEKIFFANIFIGLNTISVENFPSGMYWVKAENG